MSHALLDNRPLSVDGLSVAMSRVLRRLGDMPLATAHDIARFEEYSFPYTCAQLLGLQDRGLVEAISLGMTQRRVSRWILTGNGRDFLGEARTAFHEDWALCRFLELLPAVEWAYQSVFSLQERLGPLVQFRWFQGASWDAVVRYDDGWALIFWSGFFQRESYVRRKLVALGEQLQQHAFTGEYPWPSLMLFLVSDQWQSELVLRAARSCGLADEVRVLCIADGTESGGDGAQGRGVVQQLVRSRNVGGWPWPRRLKSSLWSGGEVQMYYRVLNWVGEWPGLTVSACNAFLGVPRESRHSARFLRALYERGFLLRLWDRGQYRYSLSKRAVYLLSARDRVHVNSIAVPSEFDTPSLGEHERGLIDIAAGFRAAGVTVASGWRSWEQISGNTGIRPDAMLWLENSPFGPGWHYLEYERRAQGFVRVKRKLRGYLSPQRQDRWPVLYVTRDERAEGVFQEVGREAGLPMLTSNMVRLADREVVGDSGCWSHYGAFVSLG